MTIEIQKANQENDPIDGLNKLLLKYNLTPNQAKVYVYLSKMGIKTASELSHALNIPRTETYHLLNILKQKGIIFTIFGRPTKFNAVEIKKSIAILIENEKERLQELETEQDIIVKLWDTIPSDIKEIKNESEEMFQKLLGPTLIMSKLEHMVNSSSKSIHIFGDTSDFKLLCQPEFANLLKKTNSELKILINDQNKNTSIFKIIDQKHIKILDDINRENFCFLIKDENEVIFFIDNPELRNTLAIWSDSRKFVNALRTLFSLIWEKTICVNESSLGKNPHNRYRNKLEEIKQEKTILNYLERKFNVL